jgi:hypothetical protein
MERLVKSDPGNVSWNRDLMLAYGHLALVNQHLGDSYTAAADIGTAHQAYVRSADIAASGMKSGHASLHILFIHANQRLALNAVARGRRGEALQFAETAWHAGENPPPGSGPLRALPRGLSAMGLTYAALMRSPLRVASDRKDALSWLGKSMDAWHATQSEPGFAEPHRREMQEVETALARAQSPATARISSRPR